MLISVFLGIATFVGVLTIAAIVIAALVFGVIALIRWSSRAT